MKLCLLIQLNLKLFLAPNISLYLFRSNALQVVRFVTVYSKHLYNNETEKRVLRKYCVTKKTDNRGPKFKRLLENMGY